MLLSSHILAEVEELCDTVTIIRQGKAVQHGTLAELRHLTRARVSTVVAGTTAALAALDGVHDLASTDGHVAFHVDNDALPQVTRPSPTWHPSSLTITPPSLEELFLREYGDELAALEGEPARARRRRPDDRRRPRARPRRPPRAPGGCSPAPARSCGSRCAATGSGSRSPSRSSC